MPLNLCARVPDAVPDEEAAFTVLGAIALQGIRLVQPTLGEAVVVTGLGLIGLVAVQLLRAHGCRVLGLDFDADKLALARSFGAEVVDLSAGQDPVAAAQAFSRGRGVDGVIITASTKSNEPVHQAALMCRKRGRIVLVGVIGLELSRADFYEKELSFQVSCSYGPGRYDPSYEEQGVDYPVGFVRWTEQRNLEAVLDMMADGRLDVKPLISHRFALQQAEEAYALVGGAAPSLGILLQYPSAQLQPDAVLRRATVAIGVMADVIPDSIRDPAPESVIPDSIRDPVPRTDWIAGQARKDKSVVIPDSIRDPASESVIPDSIRDPVPRADWIAGAGTPDLIRARNDKFEGRNDKSQAHND